MVGPDVLAITVVYGRERGGGVGGGGEAGGEVMRGRTECFLKCCALSNGSEK